MLSVLTKPAFMLFDVHWLTAPQFGGRGAWSEVLKGYGLRRIGAPQPVSQLTSDAHGLGELEVVARGSVCGAGKVRSRGIDRGVCGKRADLRGANGEDVEDLRRGSRLRRRRAGSRSEWRWGW